MFVIGKCLVNGIQLLLALRVYRDRNGNVFTVAAFASFNRGPGGIGRMLGYDFINR